MAHCTESFRVRCNRVGQHVSKQWEGRAVCSRRVGCYVDGRNNHSTLVVTACSHNNVLAVCAGAQQALEVSTVFHVSITDTWDVLCANRVCVEYCSCNCSVSFEALECSRRDIIHDRVEWISDIEACVENLRLWSVAALNIHTEWQSSVQSNIKTVDLATLWTQVGLNSTASRHERLKRLSVCGGTKLLVVTTATTLDVLCSNVFLPRQENLVVVGHPTGVKICGPVVDSILCVGHS